MMADAIAASFTGTGHQTEDGIAGIRQAWLDLADHERERLMLLFPGVIGTLNGVPLATRGRTNLVTVAGFREQTAEKLDGLGQKPSLQDYLDGVSTNSDDEVEDAVRDWQSSLSAWQAEHDRLSTVQSGLDQAWLAYERDQFPADEHHHRQRGRVQPGPQRDGRRRGGHRLPLLAGHGAAPAAHPRERDGPLQRAGRPVAGRP
jgi:hypothetical protein